MGSLFKRLSIDFEHADRRGKLSQLVHEGFSQINVLETERDVMRGGHYHKISKEAFFVVTGSVEVLFSRDSESEMHTFHTGDFFLIFPYTIHSMHFPEKCIMVAMYDTPIEKEDGTKDIYVED